MKKETILKVLTAAAYIGALIGFSTLLVLIYFVCIDSGYSIFDFGVGLIDESNERLGSFVLQLMWSFGISTASFIAREQIGKKSKN